MSLSTQSLKRLPKIKAGLLQGLTSTQIGASCRVTEKTIDRDLSEFRRSGLFEEWIREEALRLHYIIVKEEPVEAYRQIMRLVGKTIVQKAEIKKKVEVDKHVSETVTLIRRYEEVITQANNRNLQQNNPQQQVDTRQSQTTAT